MPLQMQCSMNRRVPRTMVQNTSRQGMQTVPPPPNVYDVTETVQQQPSQPSAPLLQAVADGWTPAAQAAVWQMHTQPPNAHSAAPSYEVPLMTQLVAITESPMMLPATELRSEPFSPRRKPRPHLGGQARLNILHVISENNRCERKRRQRLSSKPKSMCIQAPSLRRGAAGSGSDFFLPEKKTFDMGQIKTKIFFSDTTPRTPPPNSIVTQYDGHHTHTLGQSLWSSRGRLGRKKTAWSGSPYFHPHNPKYSLCSSRSGLPPFWL